MRLFKLQVLTLLFALYFSTDGAAQNYYGGQGDAGGGRGARGGDYGGGRGARGGGDFGARGGGRMGRGGFGGEGGGFFGGRMGRGGAFGGAGMRERATSAPLELHGIIGRGADTMLSIVNLETGESRWVRIQDPKSKWYVESVNAKARSAVVRLDGMAMKLELMPTTGEPMSIRPQAAPLAANDSGDGSEFDARALAGRMMAFDPSNPASQEAMRSFGAQMRDMSPEQRMQVFSQFRQMREAAGQGGGGVVIAPAAMPSATPVTLPATLPAAAPAAGGDSPAPSAPAPTPAPAAPAAPGNSRPAVFQASPPQ